MGYYDALPKQIRVGPFDIRVEVKDKVTDEDDLGLCVYSELLMQLRAEQASAPFALDTLLHEVSHMIYRTFALAKGNDEEQIVSALATGWTQVLRDNPELAKWIGAALAERPAN